MKKLLFVTAICSLLSSMAMAKTQGHYVGANILKSSTDITTSKDRATGNIDTYFNTSKKDSSVGLGINYGYAINFDGIFITPSVFYESINAETKTRDVANSFEQDFNVKSRFGIKTNVGYDINDSFAVYVPIGITYNNYEFNTKDYLGASFVRTKQTGTESAFLYGFGLSYEPIKDISVILEYNRSKFEAKTVNDVALVGDVKLKTEAELSVVSLGLAYKF